MPARSPGARELLGKATCAARAQLRQLLCRRRTVRGVAAYFDLITDDGRLFFGDRFHFGYVPGGGLTLAQALDAHTNLVCELAGIRPGMPGAGCWLRHRRPGAAHRLSHRLQVVGFNVSREQVRQGRELITGAGLAARVDIRHGNVLRMPLPDAGFDAAICLEAGGDICVRAADKPRLLAEHPGAAPRRAGRFQRPGVRPAADRCRGPGAPRTALSLGPGTAHRLAGPVRRRRVPAGNGMRHPGADAADLAARPGGYHQHAKQVQARYGRRLGLGIARRIDIQVAQVAAAINRCGGYPALSATTPAHCRSPRPVHHISRDPGH